MCRRYGDECDEDGGVESRMRNVECSGMVGQRALLLLNHHGLPLREEKARVSRQLSNKGFRILSAPARPCCVIA